MSTGNPLELAPLVEDEAMMPRANSHRIGLFSTLPPSGGGCGMRRSQPDSEEKREVLARATVHDQNRD
jgi:hypothetical protein